jgi:hypothetical protein
MSDSELIGGSPPPVSINDHVGCALLQQALSCVLTHMRFMGSCKLSSFDDRDDTPLYLTDGIGIVFQPPTDYSMRFSYGRRHWVWWARLNSLIVMVKGSHSCCLRGSGVSCCQVISLAR